MRSLLLVLITLSNCAATFSNSKCDETDYQCILDRMDNGAPVYFDKIERELRELKRTNIENKTFDGEQESVDLFFEKIDVNKYIGTASPDFC